MLNEFERIDDLQLGGFKIIQNKNLFCFSIDSVLLAHFATVKKGDRVMDLCSGNGIVPILLCANKSPKEVVGVEVLEKSYDLAKRSIALNNLEEKVSFHNINLNDVLDVEKKASFNVVTCNPPFKEVGGGIKSEVDELYIARHEALCTLSDIIEKSGSLLNFGGRLAIIHRPERLTDILCLMREKKIEPKRICFVHPNTKKPPTMVLVEGNRGGQAKVLVEKPIFVFDDEGNYTHEIEKIYKRGQSDDN